MSPTATGGQASSRSALVLRRTVFPIIAILAAFFGLFISVRAAMADDTWLTRWNSTDMFNRNYLSIYDCKETLTDADIKGVRNGQIVDLDVKSDYTYNITETGTKGGIYREYSIYMGDKSDTSRYAIEATYRNAGYDPHSGRAINAVMRLSDFSLSESYQTDPVNSWGGGLPKRWGDIVSGGQDEHWFENMDATLYPVPAIRLSSCLDGGYWFMGVQHASVSYSFYYADNGDVVDLSNGFISVRSLDHDNALNMTNRYTGNKDGQEAVKVSGDAYDHAYLTPQSLVGRWGSFQGYNGIKYQNNDNGDGTFDNTKPSIFFNRDEGGGSSDMMVTLYGAKNGKSFDFQMIDTEGWTHNMPFFGTLGTVEPPAPVKSIVAKKDGKSEVDFEDGYKLGDSVKFRVRQEVPAITEMVGQYTFVKFTDQISDDLSVKSVKVFREDGSEVTSGTNSGPGNNSVSYDFDLGAEDVRGHTYTFEIECEVVDYPETADLLIPNKGTTHFGATNKPNQSFDQDTNEVKIHLINPELAVEKHLIIDDDASVINDYEYLIGDVVTYEATVWNENPDTRAKNVTFYDQMPTGLAYIDGSAKVIDASGNNVTVVTDGNGWKATFTDFDYNKPVKIRYQAHATKEGNGKEIINTAESWATNIPKDVDGAETQHAKNDSEAYINDPNLELTKTVTESKIQEPDYQRGEEYRVGDTFQYQVLVKNTEPGTFAENAIITDDDMPEGFELIGDVQVTGLDVNGNPKTIELPKHFDDDLHGQQESHKVIWSKKDIKKEDGTWGWEIDVNFIAYDMPITITWQVRATQPTNGWEVYNRAWAKAENQPNDTFWSKDGRTGADYTIVWINTPEFQVDKQVRESEQTYQVGDVAAYDVVLSELKTPGTLARLTTLDDAFQTEGTTIIENSFVIDDTRDNKIDFRKDVELNRHVGVQAWHIDMTQAYGDKTGYWLSLPDYRYEFKDGVIVKVEDERNPVNVKQWHRKHKHQAGVSSDSDGGDAAGPYGNDYFEVHYEATINDAALQNKLIVNKATADSKEQFPVEDTAEVTVIGGALEIVKSSTDHGSFKAGDTARYDLDITNNATGTTANNVMVRDQFTTAKAGAVAIVDGSVTITDNRGKVLPQASGKETEDGRPDGWEITWIDNESGTHIGFEIATHMNLKWKDKITVSYSVKYLTNNGSDKLMNVAKTWADNAPEVQDDHETWPADSDQTDLIIDKGSDKQQYAVGDTGIYMLHVTNKSKGTVKNVTINDDLSRDTAGIAHVVKGSVKVTDERGNAVSAKVTYHQVASGNLSGFMAETGHDLTPDESMDVTYKVYFEKASQKTAVDNSCWAAGDNTGKATDDHEVILQPEGNPPSDDCEKDECDDDPCGDKGSCGKDPCGNKNQCEQGRGDGGNPSLAVSKEANAGTYSAGDTARYTVRVTNTTPGSVAENVTITDALSADSRMYARIVEGSGNLTDAMGAPVSVRSVSYDKGDDGRPYGLTVMTAYSLENGGALVMSYDVEFDYSPADDDISVRNSVRANADNAPQASADKAVTVSPSADVLTRDDNGRVSPTVPDGNDNGNDNDDANDGRGDGGEANGNDDGYGDGSADDDTGSTPDRYHTSGGSANVTLNGSRSGSTRLVQTGDGMASMATASGVLVGTVLTVIAISRWRNRH